MSPSCLKINRRLLPVKASYFFTLGAIASLFPYVSVYMKQLGLSPSECAIIYGTMPFIDALLRPIIGALADKLQSHKAVLAVSCAGTGLAMAGLIFVPPTTLQNPNYAVSLICAGNNANAHLSYCTSDGICMTGGSATNMSSYHESVENSTVASQCALSCEVKQHVLSDQDMCFRGIASQEQLCLSDEHSNITTVKESWSSTVEFSVDSIQQATVAPTANVSCLSCYTLDLNRLNYSGAIYDSIYCPQMDSLNCNVTCGNMNLDIWGAKTKTSNDKFGRTFLIFFAIFLLGNIFFSPIFSMIDAMTYAFLGDERSKWGEQRMWGTVGFAIFGFGAGLSMDLYSGGNSEINYTLCFTAYALLNLCATVSVCLYDISEPVQARQVLQNLVSLLRNVEVVSILVLVFVTGMLVGVRETFLFWHLQNLGGSQLLLGLCMLLNCLPEVPMLFMSGHIMRYLGLPRCLYLVCVAAAVRFAVYSMLTSPWWVLFVEPLQSVTFGLMYATCSAYASSVTPAGMHATVQGVIAGLHFGFGKGCGSLLGGVTFEQGATLTFQLCSGLAVLLLLFMFSTQLYIGWHSKHAQPHTAKDELEKEPMTIEKGNDQDQLESTDIKPTDALQANNDMANTV